MENVIHRFFAEAFEGSGLRIKATNIAESAGPKAAIKSIELDRVLSPPAMMNAKNQATHEIRKVRMKKDRVGWVLISEMSPEFFPNVSYTACRVLILPFLKLS